jgi:hypothetical protein
MKIMMLGSRLFKSTTRIEALIALKSIHVWTKQGLETLNYMVDYQLIG